MPYVARRNSIVRRRRPVQRVRGVSVRRVSRRLQPQRRVFGRRSSVRRSVRRR